MTDATRSPDLTPVPWWRDPVIYQIYPRSFRDRNGDGIGDLPGIIERLPVLAELGVDAIWVSPFYVSPMHDAGYDVANYRDIDPLFGTLDDADRFIETAHSLGLRVLVDLVPNHTSSEHPWFQAALRAGPGSPERDRYLFRDGRGAHGELPPNNWPCVFGGKGWTRVTEADGLPGQWYLHLFDTTQPDLNWDNPEVREEFRSVLRFWCDRGVDGFRVDVAHGLVKEAGLPDHHGPFNSLEVIEAIASGEDYATKSAMWDRDEVHEIYRDWRSVLEEYSRPGEDADRILCAEAWVKPEARLALYVSPDEMHQAFNFDFLDAPWTAPALRAVIDDSLASMGRVGAPTTWVLSNHDVVRHASRLGFPADSLRPDGIGADDPQPDAALGARRARAATLLMLALPGAAYLYQGEELGLPEHTTMPDEFRQDPTYLRTKGTPEFRRGRDGCRVPLPWERDRPAYGFGPSELTWLPQPESFGPLAFDQQHGVAGSSWELYKAALGQRRERRLGRGSLTWLGESESSLAFANRGPDGRILTVVVNIGEEPMALPAGRVLLASGDLTAGGLLPADTAAWLVD